MSYKQLAAIHPDKIIKEFFNPETITYDVMFRHGKAVADKALAVARRIPHLNPDLKFIEEAAMLHDIGIFFTNAPGIGCTGQYPYICHGYLGRELLEKKGLPKHALVCERHVGVGITADEIEIHKVPVPKRDMVPVTIEEQIICYADKFFSKDQEVLEKEKSVEDIVRTVNLYGQNKLMIFKKWLHLFGE